MIYPSNSNLQLTILNNTTAKFNLEVVKNNCTDGLIIAADVYNFKYKTEGIISDMGVLPKNIRKNIAITEKEICSHVL